MIQPFIDAATSIPIWFWCALLAGATIIGFAVLLVIRTLQEDARAGVISPRRHGDPAPGPLGVCSPMRAPGAGLPFHRRVADEYRRYQSWRRARERELGIRNGHLR